MQERLTYLFSWRTRSESADECAAKISQFIGDLSKMASSYQTLYVVGDRFPDPGLNFIETEGRLASLLQEMKDEDAGFTLNLWNAFQGKETARVGILCGETSEWVSNRCSIGIPVNPSISRALIEKNSLVELTELVVATFDPEAGALFSSELVEKLEWFNRPLPRIGWATYLKKGIGEIRVGQECADMVGIKDRGRLWIVEPSNGDYSHLDDDQCRKVLALAAAYQGQTWR